MKLNFKKIKYSVVQGLMLSDDNKQVNLAVLNIYNTIKEGQSTWVTL